VRTSSSTTTPRTGAWHGILGSPQAPIPNQSRLRIRLRRLPTHPPHGPHRKSRNGTTKLSNSPPTTFSNTWTTPSHEHRSATRQRQTPDCDDGRVNGPRLTTTHSSSCVAGSWCASVSRSSSVLPDGGVDVIWTPGRQPWIAGPDTTAVPTSAPNGSVVVGVRLRPGALTTLIGASASTITDQRIGLD